LNYKLESCPPQTILNAKTEVINVTQYEKIKVKIYIIDDYFNICIKRKNKSLIFKNEYYIFG